MDSDSDDFGDGETFEIDEDDLGDDIEVDVDGEDGDLGLGDGEDEDGFGDDGDAQLIENTYYAGKQEEDEESLETFQNVIDMDDEFGKWSFKATKQLVKREFRLGHSAEVVERFKGLLKFTGHVSRNDSERALQKVLQMVSGSEDADLVKQIYAIALADLQKTGNEKMWFSTKLGQARSLCKAKQWDLLGAVVRDLRGWCSLPSGREDSRKSSQLLDVLVLEIQMATAGEAHKKLKSLYLTCRRIELQEGAVVSNPTISGIIRECGGRMHMREKQWGKAYGDFFEAFKSYDEAGSHKRISCLKYLVIVAMLQSNEKGSVINPFDSNEAKPYKDHREIQAMTKLIKAYEMNDIDQFEGTLKYNRKAIQEDEFMKGYVADLLHSIRQRVLMLLVKPYRRVRLSYLAGCLHIDTPLVQRLACELVLDDKLKANIDQIDELLNLESVNRNMTAMRRYDALSAWTNSLKDVHTAVLNKIEV